MPERTVKAERFEFVDADGYPRSATAGDTVDLDEIQEREAEVREALEPVKAPRSRGKKDDTTDQAEDQ